MNLEGEQMDDGWGRDAGPGEVYASSDDERSVVLSLDAGALLLQLTDGDGVVAVTELPRGVALELAGALARAVVHLPAVDENGRRLQMGPDGRAWDVPLDWPAERCVTCWGEHGRHALWCPGYRRQQ
jgi:hypothetical protein